MRCCHVVGGLRDSKFTLVVYQAVSAIVNVSGGDMRKAITLLQSCYRWKGEEGVTAADVTDISGVCGPGGNGCGSFRHELRYVVVHTGGARSRCGGAVDGMPEPVV